MFLFQGFIYLALVTTGLLIMSDHYEESGTSSLPNDQQPINQENEDNISVKDEENEEINSLGVK